MSSPLGAIDAASGGVNQLLVALVEGCLFQAQEHVVFYPLLQGLLLCSTLRGSNCRVPVPPALVADSQGADLRRMNINDSVELTNTNCGEASGGFIGDSVITGNIESCSQQQWYTGNSNFAGWTGNLWNLTFSGDNGAPPAAWRGGGNSYCVLATTPVVREKPVLYQDSNGNYWVFSPTLRINSVGPSWTSTSMGPATLWPSAPST